LASVQKIDYITPIKTYLCNLQQDFCAHFEAEEKEARFLKDAWRHSEQGGGLTCILKEGLHIEKAGVNFSHVVGSHLPQSATENRPYLAGNPFEALGISSVIHPRNPHVPTTHFNVRFFISYPKDADKGDDPVWWFGGGFDLTPYYPYEEDCRHWHQQAFEACAPFGKELYPRLKKACDNYFYLKHRKEARGIGGLFFDDLNHWPFETCFAFLQSVSKHFVLGYLPIFQKRKSHPFGEKEKAFQHYRRGRYVEFNLLYDRGTLFGLQSGGRTESILMSLPPEVSFDYNWTPIPGSSEEKLVTEFLKPREWL